MGQRGGRCFLLRRRRRQRQPRFVSASLTYTSSGEAIGGPPSKFFTYSVPFQGGNYRSKLSAMATGSYFMSSWINLTRGNVLLYKPAIVPFISCVSDKKILGKIQSNQSILYRAVTSTYFLLPRQIISSLTHYSFQKINFSVFLGHFKLEKVYRPT